MHSCKYVHREYINIENLGQLEQSLGGFCRNSNKLERQDSVCAWGCACGKEMQEEAVSPPNWCVVMRLVTFSLSPSCATGPVVATLICEFFSTSVNLCCVCAVSETVGLLYSRGILGFGAERKDLRRYWFDFQTVGFVSCIFKNQTHR